MIPAGTGGLIAVLGVVVGGRPFIAEELGGVATEGLAVIRGDGAVAGAGDTKAVGLLAIADTGWLAKISGEDIGVALAERGCDINGEGLGGEVATTGLLFAPINGEEELGMGLKRGNDPVFCSTGIPLAAGVRIPPLCDIWLVGGLAGPKGVAAAAGTAAG